MKHKPADLDAVQWKEHWKRQSYTLQPLANTLKEWRDELGRIRPTDFDLPNHYGKMLYEQAQLEMLRRVLDLLPDTLDK